MTSSPQNTQTVTRPPVVAVLGHIDHGKSTLLDYIRKTNVAENEEGGITQHLSSYEVVHPHKESGEDKKITFLDTPGHEAFSSVRTRGASAADVAILVVSAEDGVKPQTLEALESIKETKLPYVIALNKIDRPNANQERSKQTLAENEIYIEEYGGDIPLVPVSAKTGEGIPELLDMILLIADLEELTGNPSQPASGIIVESNIDSKTGTTASLIIKNGTLKKGTFVVAEDAYSPVRAIESFNAKQLDEATFSSPVNIAGWTSQPAVGARFQNLSSKKEAERAIQEFKNSLGSTQNHDTHDEEAERTIPLILKADTAGSLEAIRHEAERIGARHESVSFSLISAETGPVSENDVRNAAINPETLLLGFNTHLDGPAQRVSEQTGITAHVFSVIYELSDWLDTYLTETKPTKDVDKEHGCLTLLKVFSRSKKGHVVGGRVEEGTISKGDRVKILRHDKEIGQGRIKGVQQQKAQVSSVSEGTECGLMIETSVELAQGDTLSAFTIVNE